MHDHTARALRAQVLIITQGGHKQGIPKGPGTRSSNDNVVQKASGTQARVWGLAHPGGAEAWVHNWTGKRHPKSGGLRALPYSVTKLKAGDGRKKKTG